MSSYITDKSKINLYVGYIESSVGVGLIIGPSLGTILYDVGGFTLNYWFISTAYLIEFVLNFFFLKAHEHHQVEDDHSLEKSQNLKESLIAQNYVSSKVTYLSII